MGGKIGSLGQEFTTSLVNFIDLETRQKLTTAVRISDEVAAFEVVVLCSSWLLRYIVTSGANFRSNCRGAGSGNHRGLVQWKAIRVAIQMGTRGEQIVYLHKLATSIKQILTVAYHP